MKWYDEGNNTIRNILVVLFLICVGVAGFARYKRLTFTPEPTATPVPTATAIPTATPAPTEAPTLTVDIPPLNEMCWSENAVVSWLAQDPNLEDLDIQFEDRITMPDNPNFGPPGYLREWIDTDDFENMRQIWLKIDDDNCVTGINVVTMTNQDTALGDWHITAALHGFLNVMADAEFGLMVLDAFEVCSDLTKDRAEHEVLAYTFNGFYSARRFYCRYEEHSDGMKYLVLSSQIWNDTQDWIDANPNATITFEDGDMNVTVTGE